MKDLSVIVDNVRNELASIGIFPPQVPVTINTRAKTRWGQARYKDGEYYNINLNANLLEDDVDEKAIKNVLAHEMLHTCCKPGTKHGREWQILASKVNANFQSYNIKRVNSYKEYGAIVTNQKAKYSIECSRCGKVYKRHRMCDVVRYPSRYRCKCGGELQRSI